MKAVIYTRVSTEEQSTSNQELALEKFAAGRDWDIIAVYKEQATAWKAGHQLELSRILADCRNRQKRPDIILVWALDRLTRQGPAAILNLVNTFRLYGVRVISLQETWTEAPGELAELFYAIIGWVAQQESQRRSERTRAGLDRLRAMGKTLGRPVGSRDKKRRQKKVRIIHARFLAPTGLIQ